MRVALLSCVVALWGCDVVFDLHRAPEDASIDTPGPGVPVKIHVGVDVIEPTPTGDFAMKFEPLASAITVVLVDGSRPAVTQIEDRYEFHRADETQPYRVTYTPPLGTTPATYIGNVAELTLIAPLLGRLDRGAVPNLTKAMITHTTTTSQAYAITTGLRTQTLVNESPTATSSVLLDWANVVTLSGPRGLPSAAMNDRIHHVTYDLIGGVGAYYTAASISSADLTLDPGVTTPIAMPGAAALVRSCLQLTARRAHEQDRMVAALGPMQALGSTWSIESTPLPERTPNGGVYLAYENTSVSQDNTESIAVTNPFAHEGMVAHLVTEGMIDLGGVTTKVSTSTYAAVPPLSCAPPPSLVLEGVTGFASAITIDGQLTTANVTVSEGRIAWDLIDGAADVFVVEIVEVGVANPRGYYVTTDREVVVDPGVLEPGRRYFVRITSQSGQVGASVGDYQSLTYPNGRTVAPSRVFRVQ